MLNKAGRFVTDFVRLFDFDKFFVKCSTANRLLTQCPRLAYGQNDDFGDLPVDAGLRLQANGDDRTDTRADKNNAFLPNFVYSRIQFCRPQAPK